MTSYGPLIVIGLFGYLIFGNTFSNEWTYDDWQVIVQNTDISSFGCFLQDINPGRPLRELSLMFDRVLFGMNPRGWHFQNIFWHSFNAWLLFLLARILSKSSIAAWIASILFLVHPVQVEVVANLSHRKDSLALAFCLLSLLTFFKASDLPFPRKNIFLFFTFLFWILALYAKQNSAVLPALFFLYEWKEKRAIGNNLYKNKLLLLGLGALAFFSLIVAASFISSGGLFDSNFFKIGQPLLEKYGYYGEPSVYLYYLMVMKSWAFLLSKLIWPFELGVEYFYAVPRSIADPWVVGGVVFVILLVYGFLASRNRSFPVFFSLAWFALFWLPTSNLWPSVYFAADRYLYTPSVGLFLLAGIFSANMLHYKSRFCLVALALIPLLSYVTCRQNSVWKTDETLYIHSLKISPQSAFLCNELGKYYFKKGDMGSSLRYLKRGEALNPREGSIQYNLGNLYMVMKIEERARVHFCNFLNLDLQGEYLEVASDLQKRVDLDCSR